jgi:copper resistance protein B
MKASNRRNRRVKQKTMMTRRIYRIVALLVFKLSSSWAQDLSTVENGQTHAEHANHSVQTEQKRHKIKYGAKTKPAPEKTSEEIRPVHGMDHGKMNHNIMPSMNQWNKSGTAEGSGYDRKHGEVSGKTDHMNQMSDESMSMQGGSAPPDARDPHAYSDGYDFGPIPRPRMGDEDNFG